MTDCEPPRLTETPADRHKGGAIAGYRAARGGCGEVSGRDADGVVCADVKGVRVGCSEALGVCGPSEKMVPSALKLYATHGGWCFRIGVCPTCGNRVGMGRVVVVVVISDERQPLTAL